MRTRIRRILCCGLVIAVTTLPARGQEPAPDSDLASAVRSAAARAQALERCELRIVLEREYRPAENQPAGPHPHAEKEYSYFEKGRFYRITNFEPDPKSGQGGHEMSFDGTAFYVRRHFAAAGPKGKKYPVDGPERDGSEEVRVEFPYLEAIGISVPPTARAWRTQKVGSLLDELSSYGGLLASRREGDVVRVDFEIPEPGVTTARFDPEALMAMLRQTVEPAAAIEAFQQLRSLKPTRRVEFVLDAAKGMAVRRRDDYAADGERIQQVECTDFEHFAAKDLWLPRKCTYRVFPLSGPLEGVAEVPQLTVVAKLEEISFERRADVAFSISFGVERGAVIRTRGLADGARTIEVPASDQARDMRREVVARPSNGTTSRVLIVGNIVVLVCVFGYWLSRRIRRNG